MKIAIPTAKGILCMHFGHCEAFTFVEIDQNSKKMNPIQFSPTAPSEAVIFPVGKGSERCGG